MISLHRLNGTEFWLNPDLIEQLDKTPDTVITLSTGNNFVVRESIDAVMEKVVAFKAKVASEKEKLMERVV